MDRVDVTHSQLLAALVKAQRGDQESGGALRTRDLKSMLNLSMDSIRAVLHELMGEGIVECVRIRVTVLDGRQQMVPHYRIVDRTDVNELVSEVNARNGAGE